MSTEQQIAGAGENAAPATEPLLSDAELHDIRMKMLGLGLAHTTDTGDFVFGPNGMTMYGAASIALLKRAGCSIAHMGQIGGIHAEASETFVAENPDVVAAWEAILK